MHWERYFITEESGHLITECKPSTGNIQSLSVVNVLNLQNKVEKNLVIKGNLFCNNHAWTCTHHVGM